MQVELPPIEPGAGAAVEELLARYRRGAIARAERIVDFATARRCRHRQVAEHFGETLGGSCGACDVCAPPRSSVTTATAAPLPDDVGRTIVDAVEGLAWPLGRKSLAAMLRGAVSAPPSARRSPAYGCLAGASDGQVQRWIRALETAGALIERRSPDGFRLLHPIPGAHVPALGPSRAGHTAAAADGPLVSALRSWRATRSRLDGVPAYVVFSDATLHEIAAAQPASAPALAAVKGIGPTKLERYGDEVLEVVAGTSDRAV
jgi:ATP-dependent DNA helicase RecQ